MLYRGVLNLSPSLYFSNATRIDRFERLIQVWLGTDPQYVYRFKSI